MGNICTTREQRPGEAAEQHAVYTSLWQEVISKLSDNASFTAECSRVYREECQKLGAEQLTKSQWQEMTLAFISRISCNDQRTRERIYSAVGALYPGSGDRMVSESTFMEFTRLALMLAERDLRDRIAYAEAKLGGQQPGSPGQTPVNGASISQAPAPAAVGGDPSLQATVAAAPGPPVRVLPPTAVPVGGQRQQDSPQQDSGPPSFSSPVQFSPSAQRLQEMQRARVEQEQRMLQQQRLQQQPPLQQQQQPQLQPQPQPQLQQQPQFSPSARRLQEMQRARAEQEQRMLQQQRLQQQPPLQQQPQPQLQQQRQHQAQQQVQQQAQQRAQQQGLQSPPQHDRPVLQQQQAPQRQAPQVQARPQLASPRQLQEPALGPPLAVGPSVFPASPPLSPMRSGVLAASALHAGGSAPTGSLLGIAGGEGQALSGVVAAALGSGRSGLDPARSVGQMKPPALGGSVAMPQVAGAASRLQPASVPELVEEMKNRILCGRLGVAVFNEHLQLEPKRLALNPKTRRLSILREDGLCEDSWEIDDLRCMTEGIASTILSDPPPPGLAMAFRFKFRDDNGTLASDNAAQDRFLCVVLDTAEATQLALEAFSQLCRVPVVRTT